MKFQLLRLFLLLFLILAIQSHSAIVRIPDDEEDFLAALDSAEPNDTILVADGEYAGEGNHNLLVDFPITFMSENGPQECIINCQDQDATSAFHFNESVNFIGFAVINADTGIYGFDCEELYFENCIFANSVSFGLLLNNCDGLTIGNCSFIDNNREEDNQNGAAFRADVSTGEIRGCLFSDNSCLGSGAAMYSGGCELIISNTEFSENACLDYGGAVIATTASMIDFIFCDFIGNHAEEHNGGALAITENSVVSLVNCQFLENDTPMSGGGVYLSGSEGIFRHVIFQGNQASRSGGGMLGYSDAVIDIVNCLFIENGCGIDGGGLSISSGTGGAITNCDFIGNEAGLERENGMGGGLYTGSDTQPEVINCIFWENDSDIGQQIYPQNAGVVTINNCCIQDGIDPDDNWIQDELNAEDNIEDDPVLVEGREPEWGLDGFFLDEESPCIDAGSGWADELGMDTLTTQANFEFDEDEVDIGFHYSVDWFRMIGRLFGTVTDAENDDPLGDVLIETSRGQSTRTNRNGEWEIAEATANVEFDIWASMDGYNTAIEEDQVLEENEELEINFSLTHPEFAAGEEEIGVDMNVDDEQEVAVVIENMGNGPLTWSVEVSFGEMDELNPWDRLFSLDPVEGLKGAVFVNNNFIIALTDNEGRYIRIVDPEGEILAEFEQPGEGGAGFSDLAWDGELLWGSEGDMIYGLSLDGEVIESFEGPDDETIALAWDRDRETLWACGERSDISGYNREGEQIDQIRTPDLRIAGLAYWSEAPDERCLYAFHNRGGDPRQQVYNVDPENEEFMDVTTLQTEAGDSPGACFVSSEVHPYSYTFMSVALNNGAGTIYGHNLDLKRGWIAVDPVEGVIEADEAAELTVTFNSAGMAEGFYEAMLVFTHNAEGGMAVIEAAMEVTEGPVHTVKTVDLEFGWSLVSINLQPDEEDFRVLMQEVVQAGRMIMMKDQLGHFYYPGEDFYNMNGWQVGEGYWILMRQPGRVELEGTTVRSDDPIELAEGWQIVSYYPNFTMNATVALNGVVDNVILAKDGDGNFFSPEFDFNSMERCRTGHGYILNMSNADELVWGERGNNAFMADSFDLNPRKQPEYYPTLASTGSDMSLLVLIPEVEHGEIGVWAGETLVGSGIVSGGRCGVPVRGDNPATTAIDGGINGRELSLKLRTENGEAAIDDYDLIRGSMNYKTDRFTVLKVNAVEIPMEFALYDPYPNPFNASTKISYQITRTGMVDLRVYDVFGREIAEVYSGIVSAGKHALAFSADDFASGVYFLKFHTMEGTRIKKMTLVK